MTTMRQKFIKALNIDLSAHRMSTYDVALREALAVAGRGEVEQLKKKPGFTRFMFIEVCFRMARTLYATGIDYDAREADRNQYNVRTNEAFLLFYNTVLKGYQQDHKINWQSFRDEKLYDPDVELVFTMNLTNVNKLYDKYAKMNQDTEWKPHNHEYVVFQDCL